MYNKDIYIYKYIYVCIYIYIKHKLKEGPLSLSLHSFVCFRTTVHIHTHVFQPGHTPEQCGNATVWHCGIVAMWQCFNASLCESHIELE